MFLVVELVLAVWAISPRSHYPPLSINKRLHCSLSGRETILDSRLIVCSQRNSRAYTEAKIRGPITEYDVFGVCYCELAGHDWLLVVDIWALMLLCTVLPTISLLRLGIRRRFRFSVRTLALLVSVIALFLGAWSLTEHIGTSDVLSHVDNLCCSRGSVRVACDPWVDDSYDDVDFATLHPNWHYLGEASSPFPFIVTYRESRGVTRRNRNRYFCDAYTRHYLWCFGVKWPLDYWQDFQAGYWGTWPPQS